MTLKFKERSYSRFETLRLTILRKRVILDLKGMGQFKIMVRSAIELVKDLSCSP